MTEAQKYKKLAKAIRQYGIENSRTPQLARAALIKAGIYTKAGKIKPQFDESLDVADNAVRNNRSRVP